MLNTGVKKSFRNFNSMSLQQDPKRVNQNVVLTLSEKKS